MSEFEIRAASPPAASFTRRPRPGGVRDIHQVQWHGTQGPTTHGRQVQATENWFGSTKPFPAGNDKGGWGGSADFVLGYDDRVGRVVIVEFGDWLNTYSSWSAGYGATSRTTYGAAEVGVAIEVAETAALGAWSSEELDACAWLTAEVNRRIKAAGGTPIPLTRLDAWDQARDKPIPRGHITHAALENGRKLGKGDPSPANFNALWRRLTIPAGGLVHTVVRNDTLGAIAQRYGRTVAQLVEWNGIADPNRLEVGQVLRLSAPTAQPVPAAPAGPSAADIEASRGVLRTLALDVSIAGRALENAEKELTAVRNTLDAIEQRRVAALARLGGES